MFQEINMNDKARKEIILGAVFGTLIGSALGASTAMLLTPKTTRQIKNQLSSRYRTMANKAQAFLDFVNHFDSDVQHPVKEPRKKRAHRRAPIKMRKKRTVRQ